MARDAKRAAVAAAMVAAALQGAWAAGLRAPEGLTAEYRCAPCGIDAARPRLAWRLGAKSGAGPAVQKAYRILAATSRENLAPGKADLWDSGKVALDGGLPGAEYAGAALKSSTRVWWTVKAWTDAGESPWSEPAEWTTGVMSGDAWKAKWIGPAACTRPDEDFGGGSWITCPPDAKGVSVLECAFDWDGAEGLAEMVHAGVSQHEILVNGTVFNKWSGHVHDWRYPRFRDLRRYLRKGGNKIEVRVFADVPRKATDPVDPVKVRAPADVRAFIAKITLPGGKTIATGKAGWTSKAGDVKELGKVRETEWGKKMVLRAENASPAFAKKFAVSKDVVSAVLHVTGAGFYEASLNGEKIGKRVLDPAPTAYDKRMLYATYRLDGKIRKGENELKILVGHGWYDMRSVATWNFEVADWRNFPRCLAQLELKYADGTAETVATDGTWRQVESPVGYDDIFEGEVYGARDPSGPDLKAANIAAEEVPGPGGRLSGEAIPGSEVMRTVAPVKISDLGGGAYMIDFGENVAGWARMTFRGQKKGDVVSIRYDERVDGECGPAAGIARDGFARPKGVEWRWVDCHFHYTASQRVCAEDAAFGTDRVVCSGADAETYEPRFTYFGFRYAYVRGLRKAPAPEDVRACVVRTAFPEIGSFKCSHATFNKLMDMAKKAYMGNFANGVPTDCPHREKNGWTGDASIASELAQYVFENTAAYEKWVRDLMDAQLPDGNLPGIVPTSGWGYHWGNGPGWDSALSVIPWNLWTHRADRRLLDEVYPALCRYLAYTSTKADALGCVKHGLGDWIPVERKHMPKTELTSSCFYYQAQRIAEEIAKLKGLEGEAWKWRKSAAKTRAGINAKHYKGDGTYDNGGQTAQAFPLAYGIPEEGERAKVEAKLLEAAERTGRHVDFGLFGSKQVFRSLSRMGRTDVAFDMIVNPTGPSMTEWIAKGGTTLWEDWGHGSSRNHIMFGDFAAWAYQYLAGIRHAEAEGSTAAVTLPKACAFGEIVLEPQPLAALDWAEASVAGPRGLIVSKWRREGGRISYAFEVPPDTVAEIRLPGEKPMVKGPGKYAFSR